MRASRSRKRPDAPPSLTQMQRKRRVALTVLALVALTGVFALYTRPDFLLQLSNQIWACF